MPIVCPTKTLRGEALHRVGAATRRGEAPRAKNSHAPAEMEVDRGAAEVGTDDGNRQQVREVGSSGTQAGQVLIHNT